MEALTNDPQTQNLHILLIQEPPLTAYNTHENQCAWHLYQSTCPEDIPKNRSLRKQNHLNDITLTDQMQSSLLQQLITSTNSVLNPLLI